MTIPFRKTGKAFLVLGFIAFLSLGFFAVSHASIVMSGDGNMTMTNCPFIFGQAVVCNMSPLGHIVTWQSMFTSILQQNGPSFLFMLLAALVFVILRTRLRRPSIDRTYTHVRFLAGKNYISRTSPLQELFSNGILNPKLF